MKVLKRIILMIILLTIAFCIINNTEATTISASPNPVEVNKSVTITVSVPNVNTVDLTATVSGAGTSGTIRLVDGSMTGEAKTFSKSITVTPTSAGKINVSISGGSNAVLNGKYVDVSASASITVKEATVQEKPKPPVNNSGSGTTTTKPNNNTTTTKPSNNTTTRPSNNTTTTKKSNNSKLSDLKIAEGVISPEFSSSVKEYKVNVPNEVTKLSIQAVKDDSKATVRIRGNEDLKVGENNIEIIVTAEDGTTSTYKLVATRAEEELILQELSIYFIDENGEKVNLPLDPEFSFDKYEYILQKLSYKVKSLTVDAKANKEKAQINIVGNEEIKAGENTITIKVTFTKEDGLPEEKTYTIKVEREEEPVVVPLTTANKIKNWFSETGTNISKWVTKNFERIITGMMLIATTSFAGLTIYLVYDYKNYKRLLGKLAELNKENLMEKANIALNPEKVNFANEDIEAEENEELYEEHKIEQDEKEEAKIGRKGRRFK